MNENVRIRLSMGLLAAAVVHAVLLVLLFEAVHQHVVQSKPEPPAWQPPNYGATVPSAMRFEKLDEPVVVNLQAQGGFYGT